MPRVLLTTVRPGEFVEHECRDTRGKRVTGKARSNTLCTVCKTQIVYQRDPEAKQVTRTRR